MISTKGRYALRVMIDLAQHKDEEYVPLNEIAIRQEISEKYLEIVLKILVKKKLLKGRRGKGGGYQLTREPSEYTIGEILELAEGNLLQSPAWFQVPRSAAVKSSALHSLCGRNLMEWYMISSTRLHWKMC